MRYAVPVTHGKVAAHFGHCSHFAFFDVDETRKAIMKKDVVASPGHEPGFLPGWLAEEGISVIIASGMGSRAQTIFTENRIQVVTGILEDDPEIAVMKCIGGTLATDDNPCDH